MKKQKVTKISKKEMIEEIKEDLIIYFKNGTINPKSFFQVNEIRFRDIYDILRIHFILSEEVQKYTLKLDKSIRNIKNSTKIQKKLFNGEVRGVIDWNKTIEYRSNTYYKDRTKFICDNIDKSYNTKENLVLKKAINIIYNIIYVDLGMDRFNMESWYKNGERMSKIISNIYIKNIYIKKIDISRVEITDKMISEVLKSRNKIYKDSANILKLYKDIMSLDMNQVNKLFSETFIDIQDENKVFELYSIFKYIKSEFPYDKLKYNILDGREDSIAEIEDDKYIYKIYHDSKGKNDIRLNIYKEEIENSGNLYLERKLNVLAEKAEIYRKLEGKDISNAIWGGRPDLLIIKIEKGINSIVEITIGEAKYTNDKNYMYTGLEELLEYIYFIKNKDLEYISSIPIYGLLFVDDVILSDKEFGNIKIISRE